MASSKAKQIAHRMQNLGQLRVDRDKELALAYVRKGETRTSVPELETETGLNRRMIYRAIQDWLTWARAEVGQGNPAKAESPAVSPSEVTPRKTA